jgi:hypothetical protein
VFIALGEFSFTALLKGHFDETFVFSSLFFVRLEDSLELRELPHK